MFAAAASVRPADDRCRSRSSSSRSYDVDFGIVARCAPRPRHCRAAAALDRTSRPRSELTEHARAHDACAHLPLEIGLSFSMLSISLRAAVSAQALALAAFAPALAQAQPASSETGPFVVALIDDDGMSRSATSSW